MNTSITSTLLDRARDQNGSLLIVKRFIWLIKGYGWLLMCSLCLVNTLAHTSQQKIQKTTTTKYLIATVSGHGFEPLIATTDAIVQRFLVADAQSVEQSTPTVELYPFLYPKSQSIIVRARKSGFFVERIQIQLGSKVVKGDVLGYIHFNPSYQFDTLISNAELLHLKSKKSAACVHFNTDCLSITLLSEHASEYAEIKRVRFTLATQPIKTTRIQLLPNTRLILELRSLETATDKLTEKTRSKLG